MSLRKYWACVGVSLSFTTPYVKNHPGDVLATVGASLGTLCIMIVLARIALWAEGK